MQNVLYGDFRTYLREKTTRYALSRFPDGRYVYVEGTLFLHEEPTFDRIYRRYVVGNVRSVVQLVRKSSSSSLLLRPSLLLVARVSSMPLIGPRHDDVSQGIPM